MTGTLPESSESETGKTGTPTPAASQTESGTSGEQVVITKAEWNSLQKKIKALESEDRSMKDKAVKHVTEGLNRLEEKVTPLLERAAEYIASGKSPAEAMSLVNSEQEANEDKLALREVLQAIRSGKLPTTSPGKVGEVGDDTAQVFAEYDVSPNDAEAIPLLELQGTDLVKAVSKLALKRAKQSAPDSSEASSLQGGTPPPPADKAKLIAELKKLQETPTKNNKRMQEIEKELGWT